MYVHSIPNNNDNQDIVSMGTNAAMLTRQVVENGYQVAAIEMLALVQAADYLQCAGGALRRPRGSCMPTSGASCRALPATNAQAQGDRRHQNS